MKIKVNRVLTAGRYHVNFVVSDFTAEEISKMSSFGVPKIPLQAQVQGFQRTISTPLNSINKTQNAIFDTQQAAKEYEDNVLMKIKSTLESLRRRADDFTSSDEVEI